MSYYQCLRTEQRPETARHCGILRCRYDVIVATRRGKLDKAKQDPALDRLTKGQCLRADMLPEYRQAHSVEPLLYKCAELDRLRSGRRNLRPRNGCRR